MIYICIDFPTCPDTINIPDIYIKSCPENLIIIVPPKNKCSIYDFPCCGTKEGTYHEINETCKLDHPIYNDGFIAMKAKHNGEKVEEIRESVFVRLGYDNLYTLYQKGEYDINKYPMLLGLSQDRSICNSIKLPRAYIIHLHSRPDREKRMIARMEKHNIEYEFVDAISYDSDLVKTRCQNADHVNMNVMYNRMAQFACLYSHLKAIRTFLDSNEELGFIFEDDCTFHLKFDEHIKTTLFLLKSMGNFNLCSLLVSNEMFYRQNKPNFEPIPSLIKLDHRAWGMVGYIITKDYARICLDRFDRDVIECQSIPMYRNYVTSEIIPMYSNGVATSTALVMDELGPSTICENNARIHRNMFAFHGLHNYEIPNSY